MEDTNLRKKVTVIWRYKSFVGFKKEKYLAELAFELVKGAAPKSYTSIHSINPIQNCIATLDYK